MNPSSSSAALARRLASLVPDSAPQSDELTPETPVRLTTDLVPFVTFAGPALDHLRAGASAKIALGRGELGTHYTLVVYQGRSIAGARATRDQLEVL